MAFFTEPFAYEKTILSDLQGAWQILRDFVAENPGFDGWDRMLFHIDEAMSWETVRNIQHMKPLLTLITNIAAQADVSNEITESIDEIHQILDQINAMIKSGQKI